MLERVWGDKSNESLLTTLGELYTKVGEGAGSADTLHLVVQVLTAEGRATTLTHNSTTYVKFVHLGDTKKSVITQEELGESMIESQLVIYQFSFYIVSSFIIEDLSY